MPKSKICPLNHIHVIFIRRWITFKRSWRTVLKSFIGTLIFSALGMVLFWIFVSIGSPQSKTVSYNLYNQTKGDFFIVGNKDDKFILNITTKLTNLFSQNGDILPSYVYFDTIDEMQRCVYQLQINNSLIQVPVGLDFTQGPSKVVILHNSTTINGSDSLELSAFALLSEVLWSLEFESNSQKSDITFKYSTIRMNLLKSIFCSSGTFLMVSGLLTSTLLITSQPISDIRGEVRQYMMQCTLKIFPYWLGTFCCDFLMWLIIASFVWVLFIATLVKPFYDNLFITWYLLVLQGPSLILFLYCFSFMFSVPETAPRKVFILSVLMTFVSTIVGMIITLPNPIELDLFWSLFPPICLQQALSYVMNNMGYQTKSLKHYWLHNPHTMCYLIMQLVDIVLYATLLIIIEEYRVRIQIKFARFSFSNYIESFKELKRKNSQSEEAKAMEDEVHNSSDFAVRIRDVSKLFINDDDRPIAAVNNVSLGVKEFSIFGFLGANGAGKTTLIRMITGDLPPSSGTIELYGTKIEKIEDFTIVSSCPQFTSHLFQELTPKEHFKIYSLLYQLDDNDENEDVIDDLISGMELNDFEDVPVRQLSVGDARKLAIALSFYGPSKILILDEPTASLDPVACRCVQQMILEYKGQKTFILCTHVLSEAEFLCDFISILVNGSIYTVGSPQYLSEKFGKEYRIDIELDDTSKASLNKVKEFFDSNLADAKLTIQRPKSMIYAIPNSSISLAELFRVMQIGRDGDNGFSYFNCSSSSLERVFLQILHKSELLGNKNVIDEFEENYYSSDNSGYFRAKLSSFFSNSGYNKIGHDVNDSIVGGSEDNNDDETMEI